MAERFCPSCGFSVQESEVFCVRCGSRVREIDSAADEVSSSSPSSRSRDEGDGRTASQVAESEKPDLGPMPGKPPSKSKRPRTHEHDWQGKLFIGLGWLGFGFAALGGPVMAIGIAQDEGATAGILVFALFAGLAGFQYWFVRAVRDFDRRGFFTLAMILPLTALAYVADMSSGEPAGVLRGLVGLTLTLIWLEYFWRKRRKYGIGTHKPLSL